MNLLGIDYGLSKIGVSISVSSIAEPYCVIKKMTTPVVLEKIDNIIKSENIEKVIIGLPKGGLETKIKRFASSLSKKSNIDVFFIDERDSTRDANKLSSEAGVNKIKRKQMEDAYSATLILQKYIDENRINS